MQPSSATDVAATISGGEPDAALGRAFAEALHRKDFAAIQALLAPDIDFRGLTPGRVWEETDAAAVVDNVLCSWFEESDELDRVVCIETGRVADRRRVSYRFEGHNPDGQFVVEQQAYYTPRDGRIVWMRVLCSGFRPR